jgi:hypothetical protein
LDFDDSISQARWENMGLFERLCWWWAKRNSLAMEQAERIEARVCRFEDLFGSETRDEAFTEMLRYVTSFPDGFRAGWEYKPELFLKKTNVEFSSKFPKWDQWDADRAGLLYEHCNGLMERLGYGSEATWKEMTGSLVGKD